MKRLMSENEKQGLRDAGFRSDEIYVIKKIFAQMQNVFNSVEIFNNKNYCYLDNILVIGK